MLHSASQIRFCVRCYCDLADIRFIQIRKMDIDSPELVNWDAYSSDVCDMADKIRSAILTDFHSASFLRHMIRNAEGSGVDPQTNPYYCLQLHGILFLHEKAMNGTNMLEITRIQYRAVKPCEVRKRFVVDTFTTKQDDLECFNS